MNNNAIEAEKIRMTFGKQVVLDQVDLQMPRGTIYAICGKNGSGKSVFLRILTGLICPSNGIVKIFGQSVGEDVDFPLNTGVLIDHPGFLLNETGFRNLELLAMISCKANLNDVRAAMRFVGLDPEDRKLVSSYSVGMRQRLGIAQAIMEKPDLILLDEPTAGLDFEAQKDIYSFLFDLRSEGKTILFTSHSYQEIKLLCDRAFLLIDGKLEPMEDIISED